MDAKKLRATTDKSQAAFWLPVGVSQSCGSRYESGEREIPYPVLLLLALAYGTPKERRYTLCQIGLHPGTMASPFKNWDEAYYNALRG